MSKKNVDEETDVSDNDKSIATAAKPMGINIDMGLSTSCRTDVTAAARFHCKICVVHIPQRFRTIELN